MDHYTINPEMTSQNCKSTNTPFTLPMITYQMVCGVVSPVVGVLNTHSRDIQTYTPTRTLIHFCRILYCVIRWRHDARFVNLESCYFWNEIGTQSWKCLHFLSHLQLGGTTTPFLNYGQVQATPGYSGNAAHQHHRHSLPPRRRGEWQMPAWSRSPWHPLPLCSLMALGWNVRPISSSHSDI